jgi:hypothetical protein
VFFKTDVARAFARWGIAAAIMAAAWLCLIAPAHADTLNWNTRPATNLRTGATDSVVINGVTVTTSGAFAGAFDGAGPNTLAIEPTANSNGTTGYINSTMNASVDDESASQTTTINFSEPVYNLSVVVGDIDGGPTFNGGANFNDIVEFRANGGTVLPTSGTPVNAAKVIWTAATGRAAANNQNVTDNTGDVTVVFAGPVTSITVKHIAGANSFVTDPTQQFTYIESVNYTRSPRVTLTKISSGGVGSFNFSGTNGFGTDTITTTVSGTGVAGATKILTLANTATTVTETIPSGYLLTAATCTGLGAGTATTDLVAGTILLSATATVPGANIACTYTNGKRPTLQARKISNGAVGAFNFTGDNGYAADTVTTTVSGIAVDGAVRTLTTAGAVTTLTEAIPAGYVVTAIACAGMGAGAATPNLGAGSVTLNAAAMAAANTVVCTFTNQKTPTVKVQKITTGGVGGPFAFTQANLASAPAAITTTAINTATPAAPAAINVTTIGTAVTLTETVAATYSIFTATCTDANSGVTGNIGSFGTLTGNVLTIAAANIVAGADITCVFTNRKTPTIKVQKITTGGFGGPFTFAQTNLAGAPAAISTTAVNTATPTTPAAIDVATIGTAVTLTETVAATYAIFTATCTDANSVVTGNTGSFGTLAGSVLTVAAGNVVAGADITCVFTNRKIPTFKVQKITTGGFGGSFTFAQTNLASAPAAISTTAVNTAAPSSPTAINVTTIGSAVTLTETVAATYSIFTATCTDANSAVTGNAGSFGTLAGSVLTVAAGNVVAGADITCVFTNRKIPTVKVQKITTGGFGGPFTFAQTNLASAPAAISTTAVGTAAPPAPTAISVTTIGTSVTLTETVTATYSIFTATCTDSNSAVTSNPASFGALAGNILTIAAGNVVAGADITCVFTNRKIPTVKVQKITTGAAGGPFTFSQTNLVSAPGSITTSAVNTATPASPTAINVSAIGTAVTLTETVAAIYVFTTASCTDANSGITGNPASFGNVGGTTITIPATNVVAGADITCVFSNAKLIPAMTVTKSSSTPGPVAVGNVITYTYVVANTGNTTINSISVSESFNGNGTLPFPRNETLTLDAAPTGDSSNGVTNDGTWAVLGPGDRVTFTAPYTVTQTDVDLLQ